MRVGLGFDSPDQVAYWLIPGWAFFLAIHVLGVTSFVYIVSKRLAPLFHAAPDFRFDRPWLRSKNVLQFWLGQWKHPRYPGAGILHILIFAGFTTLAVRAFSVLIAGAGQDFALPSSYRMVGQLYEIITDYAATVVFLASDLSSYTSGTIVSVDGGLVHKGPLP